MHILMQLDRYMHLVKYLKYVQRDSGWCIQTTTLSMFIVCIYLDLRLIPKFMPPPLFDTLFGIWYLNFTIEQKFQFRAFFRVWQSLATFIQTHTSSYIPISSHHIQVPLVCQVCALIWSVALAVARAWELMWWKSLEVWGNSGWHSSLDNTKNVKVDLSFSALKTLLVRWCWQWRWTQFACLQPSYV